MTAGQSLFLTCKGRMPQARITMCVEFWFLLASEADVTWDDGRMTPASPKRFPALADLHVRHYGLTVALSDSYSEAAGVCLSRHHDSPVALSVTDETSEVDYIMEWNPPDERTRGAWANAEDATRDGAYGIVIGAAECHLGLTAVERAKTRTGCDYLLSQAGGGVSTIDGELDWENVIRLEVSGIDRCRTESELRTRVRQKVEQTLAASKDRPALAGVVAFDLLRVLFRKAV